MTAHEGDPVRFACEIQSLPDANISWEKDGVPIESFVTQNESADHNNNSSSSSSSSSSRFVMLNSGILHIYGVQMSDAGNYR